MQSIKTYFVLRHISSGLNVHIVAHWDEPEWTDREYTDVGSTLYTQPTFEAMRQVLMLGHAKYCSSYDHPDWGCYADASPTDFEIVERTERLEIIEMSKGPIEMPPVFNPVWARDTHMKIVKLYTDKVKEHKDYLVLALVTLPEGMTLEEAQQYEGQGAFMRDFFTSRLVRAVCPVPEDYQDQIPAGKTGALVIAEGSSYFLNKSA
jgi:hypothetical protein